MICANNLDNRSVASGDYDFLYFLYKSQIPQSPKYAGVGKDIRNSIKHRTGVGASVVSKI